MSQHDLDLANAAGASFRADLNSALGALATCSSGASAPSTSYAYQLWADSATELLKQRNAANSAWITLLTLGKNFQLTAPVIDRAYAEYTANANLATQIPIDDTLPQNTEGTQILSVSLTPKSATNRVRLRFQGQVTSDTAAVNAIAAIFSSASVNALRAEFVSLATNGNGYVLCLEHEYVPGTTSALTYTVRVGPASAVNLRLNGNAVGRLLGGAIGATLIVEEIAA